MLIAIGFLFAFIWSIRDNQYEDVYTPSVRILFEDKPANKINNENSNEDL